MQDFHAINQTPVIEYLRLNVSLLKQYTKGVYTNDSSPGNKQIQFLPSKQVCD